MTTTFPRRRRRRLALWSAPAALLALAATAKLLSVGPLGGTAESSFTAGNHEGVAQAATWLGAVNVLEPHKAPFASGDAEALAGDFAAARADFEAALRIGSGVDECRIRVNLALSVEKLADSEKEPHTKDRLVREALDVIQAAPVQCHQPGPANAAGEGTTLDAAKDRLNGKRAQGGEKPDDAGQSSTSPQEDQLQQLEESARKAQLERGEGQERDKYLRGPDDSAGVDKPW
ncbi:hypothetical protein [Paenarthrobacter nitroguajacolicus]|uniref:hypothetical protein n=1 Tax=Paenarthrobacter nitroguajacolicus TaxID=211146 RepID=UPI00248CB0AE|nr:hypothetical protein [Paenarthrobacter nitroguajacolicus]MDI2033110.1 hypothetical protein [Paenarthrobacter nitroguajacolicus]